MSIEKEIDQITPTGEKHVDIVMKQVEDANETLFYIQDLFTVLQRNCPSVARMLANALLNYAYLPVVVQSLCVFKYKPLLSISSCLYILQQTFHIIANPYFCETLFKSLFLTEIPKALLDRIE